MEKAETSNKTERHIKLQRNITCRQRSRSGTILLFFLVRDSCCCLGCCCASRNAQLHSRTLHPIYLTSLVERFLPPYLPHRESSTAVLQKRTAEPTSSSSSSLGLLAGETASQTPVVCPHEASRTNAMSPLPMQRFAPRYLEDRLDRLCPKDSA